jgi:hypothetical protein
VNRKTMLAKLESHRKILKKERDEIYVLLEVWRQVWRLEVWRQVWRERYYSADVADEAPMRLEADEMLKAKCTALVDAIHSLEDLITPIDDVTEITLKKWLTQGWD